jgi:outer membrane receptor protein involved in Fe transport
MMMKTQSWRAAWLASAATTAMFAASVASAQDAAAPVDAVDAIVVTGTRLQASGFTAPTPVTVVGAQMVQNRGKTNIAEALNEIPSFQPSSGPSQATRNLTGTQGASTVDLRGLGASRTLVLVDGRRHVGISPAGIVDVAVLPTNLIERVETVTGGASAAYGSDAVAGVVNFILRDRMEGFRGNIQYGTSQRWDNNEYSINGAVGHSFGRVHVIAGADWSKNLGIANQYKRDWGAREPSYVGLPATRAAGLPANVLAYDARFSNATYGGLITAGPLRGTAFGPGGVPYQFNYGALVGPSLMVGGDNYGVSDSSPRRLVNPTERFSSLARVNFDLTPTTTLYAEGGYARSSINTQGAIARSPDVITITLNNPYLPAATRAAMQRAGVTTFQMGRLQNELGSNRNVATSDVYRGVLGAKGKIFGDWQWDIYGQYGRTLTINDYSSVALPRFYEATYAITGANGQPACAPIASNPYYTSKDANRRQQILNVLGDCKPFNVFGEGSPSKESLDYVRSTNKQRVLTKQWVGAASINGSPFSTWAGPVATAFGGEWRKDIAFQDTDLFGFNQANDGPNFAALDGSNSVYEFFGEAGVPLMKDHALGRSLELNGAIRQTHYQYSGWVTTWKVGAVYEPTDWLRLRGTKSRDIRAPRVTELFQQGGAAGFNITNPRNGVNASVPGVTLGNPDLQPEVADTWTGGFVFSPKWGFTSGFTLSMDYFRIKVDGVIGSISPLQIVDRYFNLGQTEYARFFSFDASPIGFSRITGQLLNLNQRLMDGVDLEARYRVPMDSLGVPGRLDVSALVTWMNQNSVIDEVGGTTTITKGVAVGPGPLPRWRGNVTFNYGLGRFSSTLQMRAFSGFKSNRAWIGPDDSRYDPRLGNSVNDNRGPGMAYWNFSARYDVIQKGDKVLQVYGVMDNIFDKDPPQNALPMSSDGGIPYDFVGRAFKLGVRMVM